MNRITMTSALTLAVLMSGAAPEPAVAQFLDYGRAGFGGGIMVGGVLGQTELQDEADFQVRAHVSHGVTDRVDAQIGAGYVALSGKDYGTDIGQLDARLQYSLHPMRRWSPFVYAGVGMLRYDLAEMPNRTADTDAIGWSTVVPIGVGLKYKVTRHMALQAGAGYTYTRRDDINSAILRKGNDVYWGLRIGFDFGGDPDPDRDGLFALAERRAGTDPRKDDSDADGLTDGRELRLGTNPLSADTDGDGTPDRVELAIAGRDPVRADAPAPRPKPRPVVVETLPPPVAPAPEPAPMPEFTDLRFAFGTSSLNATGISEIDRLADLMHNRPELMVDLRGHTDSVGSRAANLRVAGQRANHVKGLLVARGIADHRVLTTAVGPDEPIATNQTAAGRQANRRVEIVVDAPSAL